MSNLIKCPACGGELMDYNGYRLCPYCENSFSQDGQKAERVSIADKTAATAETGADVYENNIGGVLEISWSNDEYRFSGSGLIVTNNGYAVTNTHVVTDDRYEVAETLEIITGNGFRTTGRVIALGDDRGGHGNGIDLALIKLDTVPDKVNVLSFADFNNVKIGQSVYVIGNSLGYGSCITSGIVSDKSRNVDGDNLLMTDCAINHGNSGGPMFNADGKVIGVVVSGISNAEGMNFAVKGDDVVQWLAANNVSVK